MRDPRGRSKDSAGSTPDFPVGEVGLYPSTPSGEWSDGMSYARRPHPRGPPFPHGGAQWGVGVPRDPVDNRGLDTDEGDGTGSSMVSGERLYTLTGTVGSNFGTTTRGGRKSLLSIGVW